MVNKSDFAVRLQQMMDYYELSAASLADSIGIQRSSISHLLSGRNNPSLDFVLKILDNYPDIRFDWFVKGLGTLESSLKPSTNSRIAPTLFDDTNLADTSSATKKSITNTVQDANKVIKKIVLLYDDDSFKIYTP